MNFKAVFWIWLNATSAAAVLGRRMAGGQAHIAFGWSGAEVAKFFNQSHVHKVRRQWTFRAEAYRDIPAHELTIVENSPKHRRALECRFSSRSSRSRLAYPLWKRAIIPIKKKSRPRQAIIIIRDLKDRFHVRLIDAADLHRLPDEVVKEMVASRENSRRHSLIGQRQAMGEACCLCARGGKTPAFSSHPADRTSCS